MINGNEPAKSISRSVYIPCYFFRSIFNSESKGNTIHKKEIVRDKINVIHSYLHKQHRKIVVHGKL